MLMIFAALGIKAVHHTMCHKEAQKAQVIFARFVLLVPLCGLNPML